MQKISRATLTALGLLPFSLFADDSKIESTDVIRESRLILEVQQGHKTGGVIDGMMPFYGNDEHVWFANLQAYKYGDKYQSYGLGLGHRAIVDNAIYGAYGFYDWQESENKKSYGRIAVGIERLTETWDFRAGFNYYVFTDKNNLIDRGITSSFIEDNTIYNRHRIDAEKVYSGVNAEIGRTLGLDNLRGYVGAYTYGNTINGFSSRIKYDVTDRISLQVQGQYDAQRGWLATGGVSYWIGARSNTNTLADRMLEPVVRDMTIPFEVDLDHFDLEDTGRNIYFASPDANGTAGTQTDPTSLTDALARATENDYIYLENGDGTAYQLTDDVTLNEGVTLWGAGSDLYFQNRLIVSGNASQRPTVTGSVIDLKGNNTVGGFKITGTGGSNGILGSNISNVTLSNLTFDGSFANDGGAAIGLTGVTTANISDITIDTTGEVGINTNASTGVTISNATITGTYTGSAIDMTSTSGSIANASINISAENAIDLVSNSPVTMSDLTINGTYTGAAIDISDTPNAAAGITTATINATASQAVNIDASSGWTLSSLTTQGSYADTVVNINNSSAITLAASTITNSDTTATNGISVSTGSTGVTIDDTTVTGTYSEAGIYIVGAGTSATVSDSNITNSDDDAIYIYDGASATITGTTVKSENRDGILVNDDASATIMNVTANGNGRNGIRVRNSSAVITGGTMSENSGRGILVDEGGSSPTLTSATISDITANKNNGEGIRLSGTSGDITITGSTTNDNETVGVGIEGTSGGVSITDSTANFNTTDGITFNTATGDNTLNGVTANQNGSDGIFVTGSNVEITGDTNFLSNTNIGLNVHGDSSVNMMGGNISDNESEAIYMQGASTIDIINPTTIDGTVNNNATTGNITISVNGTGITITNGQQLTCNINNGTGTCS